MDYPRHDHYSTLYARYLKPGRTAELLAHCGDLSFASVLDLCGGGGRASLLALDHGAAAVTLVDESLPMSGHLTAMAGLHLVPTSVENALDGELAQAPFDAAICQQAVTYWFSAELVRKLRLCLKQGAVFVFNTFWGAPPAVPLPKAYEYEGRRYVELSWRSDARTVEHVQVCEGHPPHTTRFQWISPDEFKSTLAPYFTVRELRDGKTSVYVCTAI